MRCKVVRKLWEDIQKYVKKKEISTQECQISEYTKLFNKIVSEKPQHVNNFICLSVKQYIYKQRCCKETHLLQGTPKHYWHGKKYGKIHCGKK